MSSEAYSMLVDLQPDRKEDVAKTSIYMHLRYVYAVVFIIEGKCDITVSGL